MSAPRPAAALEGRLILLVEDESLIVLDITRALERAGARVLVAASAGRGLERLETDRPDAAVLDITLGRGRDSEAVAARLAALGIPFLVHTGDALRHVELLERLAATVLHKPYPSHELAERVAELVREAPRRTAGDIGPGAPS